MKKALALFLSVGSLAAFGSAVTSEVVLQPLGADVFSFYSFSDQPLGRKCSIDPGPTGATIVPDCFFTNVCAKGYEAKVYVKGTGYILVTNDIPGRYLYSTRKARAPFCELKTALYQRGFDNANSTTLTMSGRAKELAQLEEHTLEFFFKTKTYHQNFGYYELDPENNGGKRVGFSLAYPDANQAQAGTSKATVSDRTTLIDGRWHHFAVVYSKTWGGYRCYCDYLYVGDIVALEPNASGSGVNLEMRLGSLGSVAEAISSALRITKKALAPEDFMHVSNEPDGFVAYDTAYQPAFLAKFDEVPAGSVMKDDSHPTSGTQKYFPEDPRFRGQTGSYTLPVWIKGEGSLTVSDDVPGKFIYASLFATTPLVTGHKSWQCNTGTTPKDTDYSFIACNGGGQVLPVLKRWTLEFFVKLRAENKVTNHLVYYYMGPTGDGYVYLRHNNNGKSVYLGFGNDTSTVTLDQPLWDGRWHHIAIVHDEDLVGGGEKGGSYFYLDGVKSTGIVPCNAKVKNTNEIRVGSSSDRYSFSVIRVTPEVLPPEFFMVASDSPNGPLAGTSLRWKLDGDAANDIANANCSNVVTFAADGVASGSAAAVGTVTYTDDRPRGKRKTGETLDGSNRQAAALAADSSVAADGFAAVTSAGNTFTVQAFVKATSAPSELANVVGVGDGVDGYVWTLALDADRQVVLKAKLAADDGTTSDFVRETGISVADGEWHQLALSADTLAREFRVYHNATLVATYGEWADPLLHNTAGGLVAGGGLGLGSVPGSVDEVQLSRDLLTADELTTMLEQGLLLLLR